MDISLRAIILIYCNPKSLPMSWCLNHLSWFIFVFSCLPFFLYYSNWLVNVEWNPFKELYKFCWFLHTSNALTCDINLSTRSPGQLVHTFMVPKKGFLITLAPPDCSFICAVPWHRSNIKKYQNWKCKLPWNLQSAFIFHRGWATSWTFHELSIRAIRRPKCQVCTQGIS